MKEIITAKELLEYIAKIKGIKIKDFGVTASVFIPLISRKGGLSGVGSNY